MSYRDYMIQELPQYERDNKLINEIYRVLGNKTDDFLNKIDDLYMQLNIDTATWGLDIWESNFDIKINYNKSYEERRANIKVKLKRHGKVDHIMLESIIKDFTGYDSQVLFDGRIIINVLNSKNLDITDRRILGEINKTKPAHLAFDIQKIIRSYMDMNISEISIPFEYPKTNISNINAQKVHMNEDYRVVSIGDINFNIEYPKTNIDTTYKTPGNFIDDRFSVKYGKIKFDGLYYKAGLALCGGVIY